MSCLQCQGIEGLFNERMAKRELKRYRKKGPSKTTQILIEALKDLGIKSMSLLDIGGGVGAVHHELLQAGIARATDIDASSSFLHAAQRESEQQGHAGRVRYLHGDFVSLATEIDDADVVTLDRVICCYHDMQSLVGLSSHRVKKYYAAIYPQDTQFVKNGVAVGNFILRLIRNPFRVFVHPTEAVDAQLRRNGLKRCFYQKAGLIWQVVVYERSVAA